MVDMVIDLDTGQRIYQADVPAVEWVELCVLAERHDIPLRCSTKTRDLFLDTSGRHLCLSGAQRAAKTTTGLYLFALDLLRRGGLNKRAWLVASKDEKCFALLAKLLRPTPVGEHGSAPPILPPALVERTPETHRTSNLQTVLVDGTIIDLRSFKNDPGAERLKSDPCFSILTDESAHLPSPDSIAALLGRCVDAGGRLILASTPRPSAVMTKLVVEPALEYERLPADDPRKQNGEHPGALWWFRSLPLLDNVFVSKAKIEKQMKGVDLTRPENRRDWLGEWVANEGLCWVDFDAAVHVIGHEARDVAKLSSRVLAERGADGHVPVTADVVRMLFGRTNQHYRMAKASSTRYVLGGDCNVNPMSTVIVQVTAPADKKADRDSWHYWVIDNVLSPTSNSLKHAERLVSTELASVFDPKGSGSPFRGCGMIMDATAISRDPTAHRHGGSTGGLAETFGRLGIDVRAPMYRPTSSGSIGHKNPSRTDTFSLLHRLIRERRLHVFACAGSLLNSFATQLVEPDGICALDARSGHWDSVMGVIDSLRYVVHAIANAPAPIVARTL